MRNRLWPAIALTAAFAASSTLAAPGGGAGSGNTSAKGMGAQQSQDKVRKETKTREREMKNAPDKGERSTNREEVNTRTMEDGEKGKGAATSQEMQQRREERKQIQQDYKEGRKSGEIEQTSKKPWWKFWGGEESS